MTAKEYLRQYRELEIEFEHRRQKLLERKSTVSKMSQALTGMPHGGSGKTWNDTMDALIDVERELHDDYMRFMTLQDTIEKQIDELQDPRYRQLLYLRYVRGMSLLQISQSIGYDFTYTRELHGKALSAFNSLHNLTFCEL